MFGSVILDIVIGLVLTYLLLSLFCSALNETLASILKSRAGTLEEGIGNLLQNENLLADFYNHDLIQGLHKLPDLSPKMASVIKPKMFRQPTQGIIRRWQLPSYIPASAFSLALVDLLSKSLAINLTDDSISFSQLTAAVKSMGKDSHFLNIKDALSSLLTASDDLTTFRNKLEDWFNQAMDRTSGWYKRHTEAVMWGIGLLIAIALNANSVAIADKLSANQTLRNALVATAEVYAHDKQTDATQSVTQIKGEIARIGLPIGWTNDNEADELSWIYCQKHYLICLAGWVLTAAAISMGAPFWFDTLNQFVVIRSTIKPQEKSADESSKG